MTTAVSAPGKVLIAGGYLVLDPKYTGLVFGLSARIHVLVGDFIGGEGKDGKGKIEVEVESPQFKDAVWIYGVEDLGEGEGVKVAQVERSTSTSRNPFVETALLYALTYISTHLSPPTPLTPTKITILADNDYYSNTSATTLPGSPNFTNFLVPLSSAHKTGLGSSAALVTAFTGAVLTHYLPSSVFDLKTDVGRKKLHNLAQAAHCAAQGKVGSGFDVAAAVYGTCVYRRFSPEVLAVVGEVGSVGFAGRVRELVDDEEGKRWDTQITKEGVTIPKGMELVMCDVDCGSETVGMVKEVLKWRKSDVEGSEKLWGELQVRNEKLAEGLTSGDVGALERAFEDVRGSIREMGERSGVPIEPREQTELLDAVTKGVKGVIGGVVPGAGGYDAVVLLVRDDAETKKELNLFLEKWSLEKGGKVKLLKAKGELEGARVEVLERYGQLNK